jgi:hypothetical protein
LEAQVDRSCPGGPTVAKRGKRAARAAARQRGQRRRAPLADRLLKLRTLEAGVREAYDLTVVASNHLGQRYVWRVPVIVPVYESEYSLRIELEERVPVRVVAENWTGSMKHTFGHNRLCMWFPDDPDERRWQRSDGLLKLIDTAVVHLFKELYWRETGEWLGDEAPHDVPKVEARAARLEAA